MADNVRLTHNVLSIDSIAVLFENWTNPSTPVFLFWGAGKRRTCGELGWWWWWRWGRRRWRWGRRGRRGRGDSKFWIWMDFTEFFLDIGSNFRCMDTAAKFGIQHICVLDIFGSFVWWKDAQTQQHLQVPQINDLQFFRSKNLCWLSDETGRRQLQPKTLPRHRQLAGCSARVLNGFWLLVYYVVNFYGFPKPNFRCWHGTIRLQKHT